MLNFELMSEAYCLCEGMDAATLSFLLVSGIVPSLIKSGAVERTTSYGRDDISAAFS